MKTRTILSIEVIRKGCQAKCSNSNTNLILEGQLKIVLAVMLMYEQLFALSTTCYHEPIQEKNFVGRARKG